MERVLSKVAFAGVGDLEVKNRKKSSARKAVERSAHIMRPSNSLVTALRVFQWGVDCGWIR